MTDSKTITSTDYTELRQVAETTAYEAGALLREMWDRPSLIQSKGFRDWVTDADFASQELITGRLKDRFPNHGFLPEEADPGLSQDGKIVWVIDPIDGTTNFGRRIPIYCVSIAAVQFDASDRTIDFSRRPFELLAGVIYDPMRDEMFAAAQGNGATLNGKHIRMSSQTNLDQLVIGVDWSREHRQRSAMVKAVSKFADEVMTVRALGSAALAQAWVACGRLDAYANYSIGPWDVAAGMLIIAEAGGTVTRLDGKPWFMKDDNILVSNDHLHPQLSIYFPQLEQAI